jgi:hypothetical protein
MPIKKMKLISEPLYNMLMKIYKNEDPVLEAQREELVESDIPDEIKQQLYGMKIRQIRNRKDYEDNKPVLVRTEQPTTVPAVAIRTVPPTPIASSTPVHPISTPVPTTVIPSSSPIDTGVSRTKFMQYLSDHGIALPIMMLFQNCTIHQLM